jgi:cobalt-zinc-cadmium resistance protein CzcA
MDGIIVLTYFNRVVEAGLGRVPAIWRTCQTQLRPVLMTCIVAAVGLMPAALSTGIGSQVQRPLALVVVGGALMLPVLILLALPVLIEVFSRRAAPDEGQSDAVAEPAE